MRAYKLVGLGLVTAVALLAEASTIAPIALAQDQVAAADASADAATAPEPLSEDEMEVLVARIALYPDELVAVITGLRSIRCRSSRRRASSTVARTRT